MILSTISNIANIFFFVVIVGIIGFLLASVLYVKDNKLTMSIGLKSFEILTIAIILLLFSITNHPLPISQVNPSTRSIAYVFTITLLLLYIFYIENEVGFKKDEPINKFKITKILLNRVPRILFSIVLIIWVGSYTFQYTFSSAILLDLVIVLLYYVLSAAIMYVLFTFYYVFFIEMLIQDEKRHKRVISNIKK
jgi:hypothetical protein